MKIWTKSSPTHENGLQSSLLWMMWLSCDLKKLSTWRSHRPLMKIVSRYLTSVVDVALLSYRSVLNEINATSWKCSQIARMMRLSCIIDRRNSRLESLDEIIAHSWKWSSDSSLLWMMWLSCIKDLEKLSTWKFRRNHRPLMKIVSR